MITLNEKFASRFIDAKETVLLEKKLGEAYTALVNKNGSGNDFLGWEDLPVNYDKQETERIKRAAAMIRGNSDALIVIGIGGSYLGTKAAVDFLKTPYYNQITKGYPEIYFLGNSFSGEEIKIVLDI
ncbi:MAG: glucose-6-phosphate isomerase, partial [Eubacteriales bacterium]|nr:glucose-6-phosphate isomerase [Eubacteriales bacterium]